MPKDPELVARAERAIERGLAFLTRVQLPNGELPSYQWPRSAPDATLHDAAMFNSALVAISIAHIEGAEPIVQGAADFVQSQMLRFCVWKFSPYFGGGFPPDLDDTAIACVALRVAGRAVPHNEHVFRANRAASGLFYTWVTPRLRWLRDPRMALVAAARWRHPVIHYRTFSPRLGNARPDDVDAAVNANILLHFGRTPDTEPVVEHLVRLLRDGNEATSDKWYEDPFVIWYLFSRALRRAGVDARTLLVDRVRSSTPHTPLQHALAAAVLLDWNESAGALIPPVVEAQLPTGAWPREPIYHGADLLWGSEALSTGYALEALSRWLAA